MDIECSPAYISAQTTGRRKFLPHGHYTKQKVGSTEPTFLFGYSIKIRFSLQCML